MAAGSGVAVEAELRAENERLRAELAALRAQLGAAATPTSDNTTAAGAATAVNGAAPSECKRPKLVCGNDGEGVRALILSLLDVARHRASCGE